MSIGYFQVDIGGLYGSGYLELEESSQWRSGIETMHSSYVSRGRCSGDTMYLDLELLQIVVF